MFTMVVRFVWCMIDHRYELGRQAAMTKLSSNKTVRRVRVRGGNFKFRALRLDTGNYSWGSEAVTRKARILDVVYNSSNNELVRTQTLVKNAIVQVDAAPFRQWYSQHYGLDIGKKKKVVAAKKDSEVICLLPLQFVFQSCFFCVSFTNKGFLVRLELYY
jgi:ribosomal protein eS8